MTALGVDYAAPQPGTLNWISGDLTPKIVRLPILHNPLYTWGSSLTVSLANPVGAVLASPMIAPISVGLTITDMDPNPAGQLTFLADASDATVTVRDDAGFVPIRVERTGGTLGTETCTISLTDGDALAGTDYTVPGSTTLSWNSGEGGVKTLMVPLLPRLQAKGSLLFYAGISMTNGNANPGFGDETISIIDHLPTSAGTLGYPATLTVRELAGNAVVTVTRVGGASGAVSVDYATGDHQPWSWSFSEATAGTNYIAVSGTLNWASNDASPRTIFIPLTADGVASPPLDFGLVFTNPTGGLIVPMNPTFVNRAITIVNILDDDGTAGLFALSPNQVTVDELSGQAVLEVTRSGGTAGAVSVDYVFGGGTAVSGVNYVGSGGTLNWLDGDATPRQITIAILHDGVATPDLGFSVWLTNPLGGAGLDGGNVNRTWATVTIGDRDGGSLDRIAFVATAVQVHESNGPALVSLVRSGSGVGPAAVQLIINSGTAQQGVDYTFPSDALTLRADGEVVQWADGELGVHTLSIPLVHDGLPGPSRDFSVTLGLAFGNAQVVAPYQAVVTILDDDAAPAGTIAFTPGSLSARSDDGVVQLTLRRSGGSAGAISVDWSTLAISPSDAVPNVDVVASAGTVSWIGGDSADKTIAITLLDDGQSGPGRTLVVRLTNAQGSCVIGGRDAVVTITDAGPVPAGTIACLVASQSGVRTAGSAAILVGRSGSLSGRVTVSYRTVAATALDGRDFLPVVGTLSWASGDASVHSIAVPLLAAPGMSADYLRFVLSDPTGGAVLGRSSTVLTLPGPPALMTSTTNHCGSGGASALIALLAIWLGSAARLQRPAQAGDQQQRQRRET